MNNLNQMGKAAIAMDAQRQALPGWRNPHPSNNLPQLSVFWPVAMFPNIERSDVYRLYENMPAGLSNPTPVDSNGRSLVPYMAIFVCPTSPPPDNADAYISYAGNCGGFVFEPGSPVGRQWKGDGALLDAVGQASGSPAYTAARLSLDVISSGDGTSNTLLLSEKSGRDVDLARVTGAPFAGLTQSSADVTAPVATWPVFGAFTTTLPMGAVINAVGAVGEGASRPSSGHPGGVIASFCDGRTVFVRDTVASHVYAQLLTSDTRWATAPPPPGYKTNSGRLNSWLMSANAPRPYSLSEGDY